MENDKEISEENKVTQQQVEKTDLGNQHESKDEVSQEDANPEENQHDHDHDDHHEEEHHVDYGNFSKKQLLSALKGLMEKGNYVKYDPVVNDIKTHFEEDHFNKEKEEALKSFVQEGGAEDDFFYRQSEDDKLFFALYGEFKNRRSSQIKELEESKEKNLYAKNQILEQLRELVDGEETTHSISTIKDIQKEWKEIGPVPGSQNKNLWASYNALMDRFYDNRSIYFELKELDRKKNLESKLELCSKAEALDKEEDLRTAIKTLNELHEEFKHIGPVPRDEQEAVWQRFKAASDAIYAKRKAYYESQKEVFKDNQTKKEELIQTLNGFKDFKANRIKEWNAKTKEILEIQKQWEAIGPVPRESGREINRSFWGAFKHFFHNKNLFFKELDEIRRINKEKAEELIKVAESYQDSTDWQNTSNSLIKLQQDWKKLGPTPEKVRDDLYKRFKTACDTFFDNRRQANKEINEEFDKNLTLKEEVCEKIKSLPEGGEFTVENLEKLVAEYNAIGFVPRKNIKEIASKFNEAVESCVEKLDTDGENREEFLFRLNLNKIQGDPNSDRVFNKKEHGIRKQISDLENNITLWKNNLEFFASSKTADKLKNQFDEKIEKAEEEIEKLKKKLSILREF
ncbi:DUF349 domain-containing protein [Echinicola strongylocentroti]|uniref:DUF349 domain-containing protein n=1 Tax=Echinicola strongylocentroti TaxID=1795355 RepID=A0A2Z4IDY8_9BACT|nr:DUF349 domain-containing protein [Echinicola strongylocentroti]AWW28708.1 DUF349 domain-containing protein [Echinicola strongylocentroti]